MVKVDEAQKLSVCIEMTVTGNPEYNLLLLLSMHLVLYTKSNVTLDTTAWPLSHVNLNMPLIARRLNECLATHTTGIRFFPRVDTHVLSERRRNGEALRAYCACVWALSGVNSHVFLTAR